ncbi:hypothetical protein EAO77_34895 [Streptomyces sp. t39]|nr:hypothetical protein EAO77_34895 [Streptomyces sp. t39]
MYTYDNDTTDDDSGSGPAPEPEPEPEEQVPAGPLYVPVRPAPAHAAALRLFRTAPGPRTAVAFTCPGLLAVALGPEASWIVLSESALRALAEPLGVTRLTLDPVLCLPPVRTTADESAGAPHGTSRPAARAA